MSEQASLAKNLSTNKHVAEVEETEQILSKRPKHEPVPNGTNNTATTDSNNCGETSDVSIQTRTQTSPLPQCHNDQSMSESKNPTIIQSSTNGHRKQVLNPSIFNDAAMKSAFSEKYKQSAVFKVCNEDKKSLELFKEPFPHTFIHNFITEPDYLTELESELNALPMTEKNNDLYKFSQSSDLNGCQSPALSLFRVLCEDVKTFLSDVTQIPLNSKIDLFCSKYRYTDVLLCHDDELEERRIAFIYYLVPEDWSLSDGGMLDLFDCDENLQPKQIVKSIVPERNSFLFFEVSAKSFHQVSEILSENKTRLSISGWFHGPPLIRPAVHADRVPPTVPCGSIEEEVFYAWINPLYLAPDIQTDIRRQFEEDSEIELADFLQEEKYQQLAAAVQDGSVHWLLRGPANKRKYFLADGDRLPPVVAEFLKVMHSDAAFLVLSSLTGLRLHPLAAVSSDEIEGGAASSSELSQSSSSEANPRCRSEIRKWEHGCYTLAHDTDQEMQEFSLDTVYYIGCDTEWSVHNGGYTSYIARGEDDELLSVSPCRNSLALVYRDKDTMKFVKHLNHKVTGLNPPGYYDVSTVYYE